MEAGARSQVAGLAQGAGVLDGGSGSRGQPLGPVGTLPSEEQASQMQMLVERLGWRTCEVSHVTIREYSVWLGSALQMDHVRLRRRADAYRLFVEKRWDGPRTHRG